MTARIQNVSVVTVVCKEVKPKFIRAFVDIIDIYPEKQWVKNWSLRNTTSNDSFIWYMTAYLRCFRANFEIWGEPIISYSTKAIVIELIKQNMVIDGVEGSDQWIPL